MTVKIIAIILAVVSVCFSFYAVLLMRGIEQLLQKRESDIVRKYKELEILKHTSNHSQGESFNNGRISITKG